jgi:hypothetical protein
LNTSTLAAGNGIPEAESVTTPLSITPPGVWAFTIEDVTRYINKAKAGSRFRLMFMAL